MSRIITALSVITLTLLLAACGKVDADHDQDHIVNQTLNTVLTHPERPHADHSRDKRRKPAEVMEFFALEPGMDVLEILAGGGYYTEILSRVVGNNGSVVMQNNKKYYDFQSDRAVSQRLNNQRLPNVQRWDKELNALGLSPNQFDAAFFMLVFHDLYWMTNDVERVVLDIFSSIKPGGIVGIVDHAAPEGSGADAARDLNGTHRIEEAHVIEVFEKAGFVLEQTSELLRNGQDDRTQAFFSETLKNKPTDRFVLKFRKPA